MQPITFYIEKLALYEREFQQQKTKEQIISSSRILLALLMAAAGYAYYKTGHTGIAVCLATGIPVFIILMRWHDRSKKKLALQQVLVIINKNEIALLNEQKNPASDGIEFATEHHPYTYDLDIFGKNSLYHHLNRTSTYIGGFTLAEALKKSLPAAEILAQQEAIRELKDKAEWRQQFMAIAMLIRDRKNYFDALMRWSAEPVPPIKVVWKIISYAGPILFLSTIIAYNITGLPLLNNFIYISFFFNLVLLWGQLKNIKREIYTNDGVSEPLRLYSQLLAEIEKINVEAPYLLALKAKLMEGEDLSSKKIHQLFKIFSQLDGINNALGAAIMNGSLLFHLHSYHRLIKWKKNYAMDIAGWLNTIGEIEKILTLANFSFNNPHYCFPVLNDSYKFSFSDLGHPLINEPKRIGNDVSFIDQNFIILTGSNMSGKSTFLRTIGVNLVLAGTGAPVCAKAALLHPIPLLVSMRISDSLADSESYFFSEVKRLKTIITGLEKERCFILLDEILRGTNSDDKRSGTIGVIHNLIRHKAIGMIATHDLEVCLTTKDYPDVLSNKCFEVEIIDNELVFDYVLRDGICKNKSATFLMKKMEIIR